MKFFLMRHGEAEYSASSDEKRSLTPFGANKVTERIRDYSGYLSEVDIVIHSPYQRTFQTAELAAAALDLSPVIESSSFWTPNADPLTALESLAGQIDSIPLIITHMPIISMVEALCCEGAKMYAQQFNCAEISEITAEWPGIGFGTLIRRF